MSSHFHSHCRTKCPQFVVDNIDSIEAICKTCRISYASIARSTGLSGSIIRDYAVFGIIPGKSNYNKLATFFDWEVWK